MARSVPRASVSAAGRHAAVPGDVPDRSAGDGDVVLRLLHTADWHLGRRFPSFPEDAQKKLSRARLDVVSKILSLARRQSVHAILCAGDVFDDPSPSPDFWEGLVKTLRDQPAPHAPLFFVPGNHDPLTAESVWAAHHPFRAQLPPWVHVVDRDDFSYELTPEAVLYARPCRSKAGENDLAMALPAREPGDSRIRIGCVHGCTFDLEGYQTNFPICRDAGVSRGLNYLAIGDTHSFRDVTAGSPVPTVYPGTPEPTTFGEAEAGSVALVALFRQGLRPRVNAESVAFWRWIDVRCRDLNELRSLLTKPDLSGMWSGCTSTWRCRWRRRARWSASSASWKGRMRRTRGRGSSWWIDRGLRLVPGGVDAFPENLPPVVRATIERLDRIVADSEDEAEKDTADAGAVASLQAAAEARRGGGAAVMKLCRLLVTDFAGIAHADIELGPGLNVLYGPNDLGKSTLADAIRVALLLPHTSSHAEQYIPWTGGNRPLVELTFETEAQRFWRVQETVRQERILAARGIPRQRRPSTRWRRRVAGRCQAPRAPALGHSRAWRRRRRQGTAGQLSCDRAALHAGRRRGGAPAKPRGRSDGQRQGAHCGGAAGGRPGSALSFAASPHSGTSRRGVHGKGREEGQQGQPVQEGGRSSQAAARREGALAAGGGRFGGRRARVARARDQAHAPGGAGQRRGGPARHHRAAGKGNRRVACC